MLKPPSAKLASVFLLIRMLIGCALAGYFFHNPPLLVEQHLWLTPAILAWSISLQFALFGALETHLNAAARPRWWLLVALIIEMLLLCALISIDPKPAGYSLVGLSVLVFGYGSRYGLEVLSYVIGLMLALMATVWAIRWGLEINTGTWEPAVVMLIVVIMLSYCWLLIQRTERYKHQLEQHHSVDFLTGLLSRGEFLKRAQAALNRANRHHEEVVVMFCDLDRFKLLNDHKGHLRGDEALRAVGKLMSRNLRDYDLGGRFGGDEFVILLPDSSLTIGENIAKRLRSEIGQLAKHHDWPIGISIGLSSSQNGGYQLETLLEQADRAVYAAKQQAGKNAISICRGKNCDEPENEGTAPQLAKSA